jgi:ribosome-associated protein
VHINSEIEISESSIQEKFVRSSGPGGQNVNKVSTAVQLNLNLNECYDIPESVMMRLIKLAGNRINKDGILSIQASNFRTQHQNREDARNRLKELIQLAAKPEKNRIKTRSPRSANLNRLKNKKITSQKKNLRKTVQLDED